MPPRKTKPTLATHESYLFEFVGVDPSYSLSTAVMRWETGIYSEHLHLQYEAQCLAPRKLAGRLTKVLLIADRTFFDRPTYVEPSWKPNGVAHLMMRGQQSEISASIPYDAAWGVALAIGAGVFKYLHMDGASLKRGTAHMSYLALRAAFDERDYE